MIIGGRLLNLANHLLKLTLSIIVLDLHKSISKIRMILKEICLLIIVKLIGLLKEIDRVLLYFMLMLTWGQITQKGLQCMKVIELTSWLNNFVKVMVIS